MSSYGLCNRYRLDLLIKIGSVAPSLFCFECQGLCKHPVVLNVLSKNVSNYFNGFSCFWRGSGNVSLA